MDSTASNCAPLRINAPFSGSAYDTVTDTNAGTYSGVDNPAVIQNARLGIASPTTNTLTRTAGQDGSPPSTTAYVNAFARFDTVAVQLISALDDLSDGVLKAVT